MYIPFKCLLTIFTYRLQALYACNHLKSPSKEPYPDHGHISTITRWRQVRLKTATAIISWKQAVETNPLISFVDGFELFEASLSKNSCEHCFLGSEASINLKQLL